MRNVVKIIYLHYAYYYAEKRKPHSLLLCGKGFSVCIFTNILHIAFNSLELCRVIKIYHMS